MNRCELIKECYLEDGLIDVTTDPIFDKEQMNAQLIAKEDGTIAGTRIFSECFAHIDDSIEITWLVEDGDFVTCMTKLACIKGLAKSILKAERVALNLMQMMSGIANKTSQFVEEIAEFDCYIYDTRKTMPLMRELMREAVVIGGGKNHRFNLSDQVLIKDNHIATAGSIENAVKLAKLANPSLLIEVECENIEQVCECLGTKMVDIIMLDNMDNKTMKKCVNLINNQAIVEASGNMNLDRLKAVASTGVDRISCGALTHSYENFDISLKVGDCNAS